MALENVLVYRILTGDNTYPHSGNFTIGEAGKVTIDDSDGTDDEVFGDFTHTGGADVPDQDVSSSTVTGINPGDTIDLRYKYTVTGSDGSSGTVYFIATNSAANYGPLMVSDFPLDPAVTYTFGTFNTDGAARYDDLVPCFTRGTRIMTIGGEVAIEELREGDRVFTRDNGYQPLRWVGHKLVRAQGKLAPIAIATGMMGNDAELLVSPNHRMLIEEGAGEMLFGERELLVPAKHLTHHAGIGRREGGMVDYFHLLFDQHEVIFGNGAQSESFFPGTLALNALERACQAEVLMLFPELRDHDLSQFGSTARTCLTRHEARVLERYCA